MGKIKHKPCPFCGSEKLSYRSNVSHGHGDCTFEGWIECECGARNGFVGDWGMGSHKDEHDAWNKWDGTNREFIPEDYETKEETAKRKEFEKLSERYGEMSLLQFLNSISFNG
jgi:hypothetical protein